MLRKLILCPTSFFTICSYGCKNIFHCHHPFNCVLRKLYFDKSLQFNHLYRIILTTNTTKGVCEMNTFTVSLFGHRQISDSFAIERRLEKIIGELLIAKEYIEFLVGRDGAFDQLAASVIRRCRQSVRDDNSALVLVLPYMTTEYKNNIESFDNYSLSFMLSILLAEHIKP